MSQNLQMPTCKGRRDGEVRMMSNGALIEMRGNYTKEEILKAAARLIEEESGRSAEYWALHGRWGQSWYKAVPDGSGEYTWVAHSRDTPSRGGIFRIGSVPVVSVGSFPDVKCDGR